MQIFYSLWILFGFVAGLITFNMLFVHIEEITGSSFVAYAMSFVLIFSLMTIGIPIAKGIG
jgi:hypothetical protein